MYFLAADRGYFKEEGLDVSFDQGEGVRAAATKIAGGAYDMGFGSLDSVIVSGLFVLPKRPSRFFRLIAEPPSSSRCLMTAPSSRQKILKAKLWAALSLMVH